MCQKTLQDRSYTLTTQKIQLTKHFFLLKTEELSAKFVKKSC